MPAPKQSEKRSELRPAPPALGRALHHIGQGSGAWWIFHYAIRTGFRSQSK